jgi:hypothetical protein
MCLINIDESVIHMPIVVRPSHLCVPFSKNLDRLLCHLDNWRTTHGLQYDVLQCVCGK